MKKTFLLCLVGLFLFHSPCLADKILVDVFDKPSEDDPLYEEKRLIRTEDLMWNDILKSETANRNSNINTIRKLNAALARYRLSIKNGISPNLAFEAYRTERKNFCPDCIVRNYWEKFSGTGITSANSQICKKILESKKFLNPVDNVLFETKDGKVHRFLTNYQGTGHYPHHNLYIGAVGDENLKKDYEIYQEIEGNATALYPIDFRWTGVVGYFELDGKLYHTDSDQEATRFYVFEYVPEELYFKGVCDIRADILGAEVVTGEDNTVCQAVAQKEYQTHEKRPITDLMSADEYKTYHEQMCQVSFRPGAWRSDAKQLKDCMNSEGVEGYGYYLAREAHNGFGAIFIDYNNDGNKEYLISSQYSSSAGRGCSLEHFRVYDPVIENTRLVTTGEIDDVYFHGGAGDYRMSCLDGAQSLITIEGVQYLLTLTTEGPDRLDKITTLEDGTNKIEQLCSFRPKMKYR